MGTSFNDSVIRIRRFLRDPDGDVWTDAELFRYWQQAALELATKSGVLERAEAHTYPTRLTYTYTYEWEREMVDGDRLRVLTQHHARNRVICYPWEATPDTDSSPTAADGYAITQPWEAAYGAPGEPVPMILHAEHNKTRFAAFDQEPISAVPRDQIEEDDPYYRTHTGQAIAYYPLDEQEHTVALYPRPTITFDDQEIGDVFQDGGGITLFWDQFTETADVGMVLETIDTAGQLWLVYEPAPDVLGEDDDSDFPQPFIHYLEASVLEWAFGADTDGFIPSLRDYWKVRKELGIAVMRRIRLSKMKDMEIRFGKARRLAPPRGPRMPDGYPAVYR